MLVSIGKNSQVQVGSRQRVAGWETVWKWANLKLKGKNCHKRCVDLSRSFWCQLRHRV